MKKIIIALAFLALPGLTLASGGEGYPLAKATTAWPATSA